MEGVGLFVLILSSTFILSIGGCYVLYHCVSEPPERHRTRLPDLYEYNQYEMILPRKMKQEEEV